MAGDRGHSQNVGKLWSEDQVVGKRWSERPKRASRRKTVVRTTKSWKDSVLEQNDQGVENSERNVGTCARAYVGNCGNRQKSGYTVDGTVKTWVSVANRPTREKT